MKENHTGQQEETQQAAAPVQETPRILVALDASRNSLTALKAAAEVASLMHADLQAVFVEDVNLLRLAGLPFVHEIGLYSAIRRPFDGPTAEREFRMLANQMRRAVAQTAVSARVNWSFQIARGNVAQELLTASSAAELLMLGRVGRTPGKRFGATAQRVIRQALCPVFLLGDEGLTYPLAVIHTGSSASERTLGLAVILMQGREDAVRLFVVTDPAHNEEERARRVQRLMQGLEKENLQVKIILIDSRDDLPQILRATDHGTLVLPVELAPLLEIVSCSAILVR